MPTRRVIWFAVGLGVGGGIAAAITRRAAAERAPGDTELRAQVARLTREVDHLRAQAEREREARERLEGDLSEARSLITDFESLETDLRRRLGQPRPVREPD